MAAMRPLAPPPPSLPPPPLSRRSLREVRRRECRGHARQAHRALTRLWLRGACGQGETCHSFAPPQTPPLLPPAHRHPAPGRPHSLPRRILSPSPHLPPPAPPQQGFDDAIREMHETELDGRRISVKSAIPQDQIPPGAPPLPPPLSLSLAQERLACSAAAGFLGGLVYRNAGLAAGRACVPQRWPGRWVGCAVCFENQQAAGHAATAAPRWCLAEQRGRDRRPAYGGGGGGGYGSYRGGGGGGYDRYGGGGGYGESPFICVSCCPARQRAAVMPGAGSHLPPPAPRGRPCLADRRSHLPPWADIAGGGGDRYGYDRRGYDGRGYGGGGYGGCVHSCSPGWGGGGSGAPGAQPSWWWCGEAGTPVHGTAETCTRFFF